MSIINWDFLYRSILRVFWKWVVLAGNLSVTRGTRLWFICKYRGLRYFGYQFQLILEHQTKSLYVNTAVASISMMQIVDYRGKFIRTSLREWYRYDKVISVRWWTNTVKKKEKEKKKDCRIQRCICWSSEIVKNCPYSRFWCCCSIYYSITFPYVMVRFAMVAEIRICREIAYGVLSLLSVSVYMRCTWV